MGLCGPNGHGKTNLLEAIYYLSFTKGYFSSSDAQNVNSESVGFRLEGVFEVGGEMHEIVCILRENGKKEFLLNKDPYQRFSYHVGKFPCVMIAPDDIQIITSGSESRRKFVDALLSQLNPAYLQALIGYNRVLQQRNNYLRAWQELSINNQLLDVYDQQMVEYGALLFRERTRFLTKLIPQIEKLYAEIAGQHEDVRIIYQTQVNDNFASLLNSSRSRDLAAQRSLVGIHKDDLDISLAGQPFRIMASQGQRKSLLFALKLAEFEELRLAKKFSPLLLLDDVFEKLDEQRMHNLLERVCRQDTQIFITDTHPQRIQNHFNALSVQYQLISI